MNAGNGWTLMDEMLKIVDDSSRARRGKDRSDQGPKMDVGSPGAEEVPLPLTQASIGGLHSEGALPLAIRRPTERSRDFLESLVDAARDRLGAFARNLLSER